MAKMTLMQQLGVSGEAIAGLIFEAGQKILSVYSNQDFNTQSKHDKSPVTRADMLAHVHLSTGLARLTPKIPLLSEESGLGETNALQFLEEEEVFWLIDPLDGTRDFIAGTDDYTINVALIVEGEPVLGYVYAPALDTFYCGSVETGAFKQASGLVTELHTRRLNPALAKILVSRYHAAGEKQTLHERFSSCEVKAVGSSLKYCLIAEGSADLSVRKTPTMLWDTAAAQCVLEAAGGAIYDFEGRSLLYRGRLVNPGFVALGDLNGDWQRFLP